MISDIGSFLQWFAGIHRRTVRDVSILPPEAETWVPITTDPEAEGWDVPRLVRHLAEGRGFFAGAYHGKGWVWDTWPEELTDKASWVRALEESMEALHASLSSASPDRILVKVAAIGDADQTVSGWRVLMMMAEHEIAHRAQIGTYAGLNGWPVAQIFDRKNEWVVAQRDEQIRRFRSSGL